jgi:predicted outer membrane repeat protein
MRNVRNPGIWLINLAFLLAIGFSTTAAAKTIYVDNDGSADFDNIQSAIDDSNDRDVIVVAEGTYYENICFKGKNITLRSTDPNNQDVVARTIIDGGQNGPVGYFYNGEGYNAPCVLSGFTITNGNADYGGGLHCHGSSPTFVNCVISGNYASWEGGGIYSDAAGPTLINCIISRNSAGDGGGMYAWESTPTLTCCIFSNNSSKSYGGGLYGGSSDMRLINCTFSGNSDSEDGGGMYTTDHTGLTNCILWGDIRGEIVAPNANVYACLVTYSNIQDGWPGEGNIDVDPNFAKLGYRDNNGTPDDPEDDFFVEGDYHLKSQAGRWDPNSQSWIKDNVTSPCIDAGDPLSPIMHEPFPNGGIINMGAYGGTREASKSYFGKLPCETIMAGDINGDCVVNFKDFALMAFHWLEER